jgi:hemerythrin-like domain-containing protein
MGRERRTSRRGFVGAAGLVGSGLLLAGCNLLGGTPRDSSGSSMANGEDEVSPAEDLMREHGVLRRILLIYEEARRRIEAGHEVPGEPLGDAVAIVRAFVEDYHEKLEEDLLFPRFREAGVMADLTDVLLEQHKAGRRVTDDLLRLTSNPPLQNAADRQKLVSLLRGFVRMYGPHAAREDTVLFPAIREIVSADEFGDLGEAFEDREHEAFGEHGFADAVDRVAAIELAFRIYDLRQFTPQA